MIPLTPMMLAELRQKAETALYSEIADNGLPANWYTESALMHWSGMATADVGFIRAASPEVVLALLDVIAELAAGNAARLPND